MNRAILALTCAQVIYWFAVLISISLSSVIGIQLAPAPALATLPLALISLSALLVTYTVSTLVDRIGWRRTLGTGALAGASAALLSVLALMQSSFLLFCIACLLMGLYQATAVYYRLAAIALAPAEAQGRAIGWVLSGSLLAAFLGPTLANLSGAWLSTSPYAGPYLLTALLSALAIPALAGLPSPAGLSKPIHAPAAGEQTFRRRRAYRLGTLNTAFAAGAMVLMMVISPLSMHHAGGFAVEQGVSVIGWHLVGMFLPSYFSGKLLERQPARRLVLFGIALFACSALVAVLGQSLGHYYVSLFLLGSGWNFMYVAGTWQYNSTLSESERGPAQGRAEVVISLAGLLGASAGSALLIHLSWQQINIALLLALLAITLLNLATDTATVVSDQQIN